jgi:hypothetical protein
MSLQLRNALAHVLWIGGAPDAGKTSVARRLSEDNRMPSYHYDRTDLRHHERLALTNPKYAEFMNASLEERWVYPTPEGLAERTWRSFEDRFPMACEDLTNLIMPKGLSIMAEGFGFTPALLAPVLTDRRQAVWLVPNSKFKGASMRRRNRPSFGDKVRDRERAISNIIARDRLLADRIKADAVSYGFTVIEIDGSRSIDEVSLTVADHFAPFLRPFH